MKSIIYFLLTVVVFITVALNDSNEEAKQVEQNDTNNREAIQVADSDSSSLEKGVGRVLDSLKELKNVTKKSPERVGAIQNKAKNLGEKWDEIEKLVEEKYPEDYDNIEKSLYPLLAEAKKEKPNLVQIIGHIDDTEKKLNAFKKKIGTTSS